MASNNIEQPMAKVWLEGSIISTLLILGLNLLFSSDWIGIPGRMTAIPVGMTCFILWLRKTAERLDKQVVLGSGEVPVLKGFGSVYDGKKYQFARVLLTTERVMFTSSKCRIVVLLADVKEVWLHERNIYIVQHRGPHVVASVHDDRRWIDLIDKHAGLQRQDALPQGIALTKQ